jgi:OPA family glycerol-3-phosphate transporter-like MFS transporter 1/2
MRLWVRRALAFLLTYLAYMTIHSKFLFFHYGIQFCSKSKLTLLVTDTVVRKPSSVLKSVLHPQDSYDVEKNPGWHPFNQDLVPENVAKVGLKVKGAFREMENGLYKCKFVEDESKKCYEYHSGDFVIKRVKGSTCRKFLNEDFHLPFCWVLDLATMNNNVVIPPLYIQLYDGELPKTLRDGDAHLEDKAWRKFEQEEAIYLPYVNLRVKPNIQDGKVLLGLIDTIFLLAYTVGLFISGWIADRVDIRKFLAFGMVNAGASSIFLGLGHRFKVHSLSYFLVISAWGGLSQSVGWPSVIAVLGRWFPRTYRMRGFVMGAWSSNLSIGNILGSVITTACVSLGMDGEDWPLGYEIPGWIVIVLAMVIFLFLEVEPTIGEVDSTLETSSTEENNSRLLPLRSDLERLGEDDDEEMPPPTLSRALMIPGVVPFALCLCFAKMGQYALLFWGPYYLQVVGFSSQRAGYLCSFFDVGGLLGGIAAGWFSDRLKGKRGLTAGIFLFIASITLFIYYRVTSHAGTNVPVNVWMMIMVGFFVNGPVSLITTAVSADLGSHPSLNGDERLIASVAGIIDGTGSFGAAMQGILIGVISTSSWEKVFQFLIVCCLLASSLLGGVVKREIFA